MKIHSTFLYIGLSMASVQPTLSHAQTSLPSWLQPSWLKAKSTDSPVKNTDRYEVTQAIVETNNGSTNLQSNQQMNPLLNPQMQQPRLRQNINLAPVETAVPRMNEKHLTPDELKELRRQLRQQR